MKSRILTLTLIPVVTIFAFGIMLASQEAYGLSALVIEAHGKAAYKKGGVGGFLPIQEKVTRLESSDVIFTGPKSRVKLQVEGKTVASGALDPSQSTIEISHQAKVSLTTLFTDLSTGNESVTVDLAQGSIIANVRKIDPNSERFEVETPTAVAAVRGTSFQVGVQWVSPTQSKSSIQVTHGRVSILDRQSRRRLRDLEDGDSLDLEPGGGMSFQQGSAPGGGTQGGGAAAGGGSALGSGRPGAAQGGGGILGGGDGGGGGETLSAPGDENDEGDDTGGQ